MIRCTVKIEERMGFEDKILKTRLIQMPIIIGGFFLKNVEHINCKLLCYLYE